MKASTYYRTHGTPPNRPRRKRQASSVVEQRRRLCRDCEYRDRHGCKWTTEYAEDRIHAARNGGKCGGGQPSPSRVYQMALRGMDHPKPDQCRWDK